MLNEFSVELPEKTKTTTVLYADKPLKLGGFSREISIEELSERASKPFIYSDSLYSTKKHPPYYNKAANPNNRLEIDPEKKFKQQGLTEISSFVICNMGKLGHGVFADRDFESGECFILYSGVITDKKQSEEIGDYGFGLNKELTLYVNAAQIGNISRFIQHMPLNFDLYDQYLKTDLNYHKFVHGYNKESPDFWEWRNLVYKAGLTKDDVAWANLSFMIIPIQGIPSVVIYNTRRINKGDQLGISYGSGYWIGRKIKPELFNLKGEVIPAKRYGYKEVSVSIPIMESLNQFPQFNETCVNKLYTAAMLQKDLQRKEDIMQPVWFSFVSEPVSIFVLRELLLQFNAIDEKYDAIECAFISELRDILPKAFTIKMYERDPEQKSLRTIYDVVCTTDDLMKWSQLTMVIKNPRTAIFNQKNKCLKITQEVIFMDIGNAQDQFILLNILTMAKNQGIFSTPLEQKYIPSGPTRRSPIAFIRPQKEGIDQILFHNPDLTIDEIENFCNLIESTINPAVQPNKEVRLNLSTVSFFQFNLPGKWSVYPSDKLQGKYIGHQVRFFNIPIMHSVRAQPFVDQLIQDGFDAELKKSGEKPSVVVDLTTSKGLFS